MKKGKTSSQKRSGQRSNVDDDIEYNDMDINPIIFDYMIRKTFNMFDETGSGDIDRNEFGKLAEILGLQLNDKKQQELAKELDKGSGTIDFDEFINIISKYQIGDIKRHLEGAFNDYDKDMDQEITVDDLLKVSEELDEVQMTKEDAELMIAFFKYFANDKATKSGGVTKEEFVLAFNKLNFLINKNDNTEDINVSKTKNSFINHQSNVKSFTKSGYTKSQLEKNNFSGKLDASGKYNNSGKFD